MYIYNRFKEKAPPDTSGGLFTLPVNAGVWAPDGHFPMTHAETSPGNNRRDFFALF